MGPHIKPPEELRSFLNELNAGVSVSPRHLPIQHLYSTTIKTDFSGCGAHEDFYRGCFEKAKPAISHSWSRIAGMSGSRMPRRLNLNYSVGELPSEPERYWPAFITVNSNPYEANVDIKFNKNNGVTYKQNAKEICTAILNHETGVHVPDFILDKKLSEKETEKKNLAYLHDVGLHNEANSLEKIAKYII